MQRDSNLLFGVFAVQLGFVSPDRVIAAAAAWLADSSGTLCERLLSDGALSTESAALLNGLVGNAVDRHGGNTESAIEAFYEFGQVERLFGESHAAARGGRRIRTSSDFPAALSLRELPGRYTRGREYARGGMGRVLVVRDEILGRDVALKEILAPCDVTSNGGSRMESDIARRFIQEARITGQLEHPSIVPLYELGYRDDGRPYYAMKLVQGESLRAVIRSAGSLNERLRFLPHYLDLCQAIAYAHSRGVIHRDIKSENVLLGRFGETAVIDWGLGKSKHDDDCHEAGLRETMRLLSAGDYSNALTTAYGSALGTPAYMAPEQARGELDRIDERSDIYSIGVVLYEILTGDVPYRGESREEVIRKVISGDRREIRELAPDAPQELASICERAMSADACDRYSTAVDLVTAVENFHNVWQADESLRAAYRELRETHDQLRASRNNELAALEEARGSLERAQEGLYLASIQLAANRMSESRLDLARGALAEAPEKSRDWEWGYLVGQAYPHMMNGTRGADPGAPASGVSADIWRAAVGREILSVRAHDAYVTAVSLGAGQDCMLTSSADGTSKLWEYPQGRPLGVFSEGADIVQGAALSFSGKCVATTRTYHSAARVWDSSRGEPLFELAGHKEPVGEARFSRDDSRLLTASADHTAKVWDASTGQVLSTLRGHEAPLLDASFDSHPGRIVTAGADKTIRTWDAVTGSELSVSKLDAARPPVSMRLSGCLRYCLCGFSDGTGLVWGVEEQRAISFHDGRIGRLDKPAFSPDSTCFVAPSSAGGAAVRDTSTGALLSTIGGRHEVLHATAFDASGGIVLTGAVDGIVKAWAAAAPDSVKTPGQLTGHSDVVYFADFSPDGRRLVTASYDRTARVWDAATGGLLATLSGHVSELQCAVFTLDGRYIVSGSWDLTRIVWDAHTYERLHSIEGKRTERKAEFFGGARSEYNLGNAAILGRPIGPDSTTLLVRDNQLSHDTWDIVRGIQTGILGGHSKPLTTQAFSPDGRFGITGSMSGESIVWDLKSGTEFRRLVGHRAGVTFADFDRESARIVTSSLDQTATIWDLAGAKPLTALRGHHGLVKTARFSPCGTRVVTSSVDTTAIVWDARTGGRLATLIGHRGRMLDAMFSPDGKRVLTADYEMARVWDLEGHELVALNPQCGLVFATWSPDGRCIVTCHKDGSARTWSAVLWRELLELGGEGTPLEERLRLRRERRAEA